MINALNSSKPIFKVEFLLHSQAYLIGSFQRGWGNINCPMPKKSFIII